MLYTCFVKFFIGAMDSRKWFSRKCNLRLYSAIISQTETIGNCRGAMPRINRFTNTNLTNRNDFFSTTDYTNYTNDYDEHE